jgi:hypothetical protein
MVRFDVMLTGYEEHKIDGQHQNDPRWVLVERIAASRHLRSSSRLKELLFYIADCAIRQAPEDATEQQIGIHLFGRVPGYNSSEDSIVRTHARLLRQKLSAYFADEGVTEELVVEVPKGHYLPIFTSRIQTLINEGLTPGTLIPPPPVAPTPVYSPTSESGRSATRYIWALLALAPLVALLFWHPWKVSAASTPEDVFWHPFFVDDPPYVIYSNALFTGDSTRGLKYAPATASRDGAGTEDYVDTYTGIGELASVYDLTRIFDAHHATFTLKRSLLVSWDEAQSKNLIFIGARAENPSLRVLQPTVDFSIETEPASAGIVNHNPKKGEPAVYSRPEHPLTTDYAILELLPGVQPGKHVLVFSGLTTFGTQAAVEYVCRPEMMAELLKQISGPKGEIRPFEAVLQTTIGGGVALQTHLVTIRVH